MIHVPRFLARCRPAAPPQFAIDRHQVDQRAAGAKLIQAKLLLHFLDGTAQYIDVEFHRGPQIGDPQNHVVQVRDVKHASSSGGGPILIMGRAPREGFSNPMP
jgi:hypothetical protein